MKEILAISLIYIVPGIIITLRNFSWDLYFWQIKEFRTDRALTHFLWDYDEKNRPESIIWFKFIGFALLTLVFSYPYLALVGLFFVYSTWVNECFDLMSKIAAKRFKRFSIKNPRNLIIFGSLSVILLGLIFAIIIPFADLRESYNGQSTTFGRFTDNLIGDNEYDEYPDIYILLSFLAITTLLFDLSSPILVWIFVVLTSPIAIVKRFLIVNKAKKKFEKLEDHLELIAITGSVGKTTTKELIFELIKDSFKTSKTPENFNTDIGVAKSVLSQLKSTDDLFIAEMGAYKKGEIRRICKNFTPSISIITDVDTQHIGLFGSRKGIYEAKTEIVHFMKDGGHAVVNGDNDLLINLRGDFDGNIHFFSTCSSSMADFIKKKGIKENAKTKVHLAKNIKNDKTHTSFTYQTSDSEIDIKVPFSGDHLVENFLIAVIVCEVLGIESKDIVKRLANLSMKLPRLNFETGDNNTLILNDSYSSSSKGFAAALNLMQTTNFKDFNDLKDVKPGNKVVVTKGIYELGKHKVEIYKKFVAENVSKLDILITSDPLLAKAFSNSRVKVSLVKNHTEMIYKIREVTNPGDIILVEGRVHPEVLKELISDEN